MIIEVEYLVQFSVSGLLGLNVDSKNSVGVTVITVLIITGLSQSVIPHYNIHHHVSGLVT